MRNAIQYYYNIHVSNIEKVEEFFLFDGYMFKELKNDIDFDIYNILVSNGIKVHQIIFNIYNSYYTKIDNKFYVLYKLCEYSLVNFKEVKRYIMQILNIDITNIKKNNSILLWENKNDYYESYFFRNENEDIALEKYYIGMSELAIRLYKEKIFDINYGIVHRRIFSFYDFFCPDNFIIDSITRDYSEFLKTQFFFFNNDIDIFIEEIFENDISFDDSIFMFIRMLYPSYFFDNIHNKEILKKFLSKINQYELVLLNINSRLNNLFDFEIFKWLKKI